VGNRIVAIRDSQSKAAPALVKYEYDGAGNLVYVHKLQDREPKTAYATTTYVYGKASFPHYITAITNAAGIPLARNEYYENGKLKTITDAKEALTTFTYTYEQLSARTYGTPVARQEITFRPNALEETAVLTTTHETDAQGNIIYSKDATGFETHRKCESVSGALLPTEEQWKVAQEGNRKYFRRWAYESPNSPYSPTSVTDADTSGNPVRTTKHEYDGQGHVTITREPKFSSGTSTYRQTTYASGLPQKEEVFGTDPANATLNEYVYYPDGHQHESLLRYTIDAVGAVTLYTYYGVEPGGGFGDLKEVTVYPAGTPPLHPGTARYLSRTQYTYDEHGNRLTETRYCYKRNPDGPFAGGEDAFTSPRL